MYAEVSQGNRKHAYPFKELDLAIYRRRGPHSFHRRWPLRLQLLYGCWQGTSLPPLRHHNGCLAHASCSSITQQPQPSKHTNSRNVVQLIRMRYPLEDHWHSPDVETSHVNKFGNSNTQQLLSRVFTLHGSTDMYYTAWTNMPHIAPCMCYTTVYRPIAPSVEMLCGAIHTVLSGVCIGDRSHLIPGTQAIQRSKCTRTRTPSLQGELALLCAPPGCRIHRLWQELGQQRAGEPQPAMHSAAMEPHHRFARPP